VVRFARQNVNGLWAQTDFDVATDGDGYYSISLPSGSYRVESVGYWAGTTHVLAWNAGPKQVTLSPRQQAVIDFAAWQMPQ
jgi:hypothetical protein